ncbi:MAG: hypothetical protein KKE59_03720 [Proteobacteria bacterium]|nr:hypothetical protein [Pseudomonadota bacterium]
MSYWGYPRYVSVGEKKAKADRKLKQLKKKNPAIQPIVIEGSAIAKTWWGKSWNLNLERYADYSNRIGRGRSYVRHGAVLDLQISSGLVESLVQGSRAKPYEVIIKIKGIAKDIWQKMIMACAAKLDSLPELLAGKFPKTLGEIFTALGQGLFPSPQEIEFNCSCPDWAYMCKHVAATLYGIGARLDEDPGLFFTLRKVNMDDLIQQTIKDQSERLLKKANKASDRMIAESDLSGMFGIDLEENMEKPAIKPLAKKKAAASASEKSGLKKSARPDGGKTRAKKSAKKSPSGKKTAGIKDSEQILKIIRQSKKGVDVATLEQKTGLDVKKIRNVIFKAFKEGIIKRVGRGIYAGAPRLSKG